MRCVIVRNQNSHQTHASKDIRGKLNGHGWYWFKEPSNARDEQYNGLVEKKQKGMPAKRYFCLDNFMANLSTDEVVS